MNLKLTFANLSIGGFLKKNEKMNLGYPVENLQASDYRGSTSSVLCFDSDAERPHDSIL